MRAIIHWDHERCAFAGPRVVVMRAKGRGSVRGPDSEAGVSIGEIFVFREDPFSITAANAESEAVWVGNQGLAPFEKLVS